MSYEDPFSDDPSAAAAAAPDRSAVTSVYLSSPPVFQQPHSEKYQVQVCNPQKQTEKSRSYVAYTVRVRKVKDGVESSSFRRFSDFLWIHDQLVQKYPSCVIPPMPEKSLTGNFAPELMMFRSRELTRFLQRVAAHPKLSEDSDFDFFLMAPWDEFTAKRNASGKENVVTSLFSSVTKMVSGKVEDDNQWYVQLAADLASRKKLLESIQDSASSMVSGWRELSQLYSSQAQQLQSSPNTLEILKQAAAVKIQQQCNLMLLFLMSLQPTLSTAIWITCVITFVRLVPLRLSFLVVTTF